MYTELCKHLSTKKKQILIKIIIHKNQQIFMYTVRKKYSFTDYKDKIEKTS